jgi:hypothetical protein
MSLPPPSSAQREYVLDLEGPRRRRGQLRLSAMGGTISFDGSLRTDLRIPLGTLQLGLIDRGGARAGSMTGRFAILKRLSATAVVPREQGVEGWLWTSIGGSALTVLGDVEDAPNAALLFTKPLADEAVACFEPDAAQEIAARSPLGAPAIYGLLFRVTDTSKAETVFRQFGLLRPLTDREVPPTLRRSLPTDQSPDPVLRGGGDDARAATSIAPPGL